MKAMSKKRANLRKVALLLAAFSLIAASCGDSDEDETKAAFIMVAPVGDAGWNFMHNEGRLAAEASTGVPTAFVEDIPEGGAEFDNAVQTFRLQEHNDGHFLQGQELLCQKNCRLQDHSLLPSVLFLICRGLLFHHLH